jgi:hypothetical protein
MSRRFGLSLLEAVAVAAAAAVSLAEVMAVEGVALERSFLGGFFLHLL